MTVPKRRGRPPKATRRPAAEARVHLLDAADRLFATQMPDEVGLKEVAREAGVSHALVTHYFGRYEALVLATLDRRLNVARDAAIQSFVNAGALGNDFPLLDALLGIARDATTVRLITWALLSGNTRRVDAFADRVQGLRLVVDAIVARLAHAGIAIPRRRVELSVVTAISTVFGLSLFADALEHALGNDQHTLDAPELRDDLGRMIRGFLGVPVVHSRKNGQPTHASSRLRR